MDGVLWRDSEPIGDLPDIFDSIHKLNLKYVFLTNNSSKTPESYQRKLSKFGVHVSADLIMTSSQAAAILLKKKYPDGGPVFIVGEDGLISALRDQGFYHQEKHALAVIAGLDRTITYEKLATATLLIRNGAGFYGTNPDRTYPSPKGLIPGAGAILDFLQTASATPAIIAGKPKPFLFKLALKKMGVKPEETLDIGDRIETDLVGGKLAGCQTALVTSGVSSLDDISSSRYKADYTFPDLATLLSEIF
jgi:4-nitrophenyl phosphatase